MLNSIEGNLNTAKDYVEKTRVNLTKAKEEHKEGRKKFCCLVCIIVVVIFVFFGGYKMII